MTDQAKKERVLQVEEERLMRWTDLAWMRGREEETRLSHIQGVGKKERMGTNALLQKERGKGA